MLILIVCFGIQILPYCMCCLELLMKVVVEQKIGCLSPCCLQQSGFLSAWSGKAA